MAIAKSTIDPLRYVGGTPVQTFKTDGAENLSVGASSVATTGLNDRCIAVIVPSTWVHMARGTSPTATSADPIIPAGSITPWIIEPDDQLAFVKVAGYADGVVSVIKVIEIVST